MSGSKEVKPWPALLAAPVPGTETMSSKILRLHWKPPGKRPPLKTYRPEFPPPLWMAPSCLLPGIPKTIRFSNVKSHVMFGFTYDSSVSALWALAHFSMYRISYKTSRFSTNAFETIFPNNCRTSLFCAYKRL
jgi:hypothetical protein